MTDLLKTEKENLCTLSPPMSWYFERYSKDGTTCLIPIDTFPFQIGRSENCQLTLPLKYISRYHAALMIHDDTSLTVFDIGSRNGTYVNGKKIEEITVVKTGDVLTFFPEEDEFFRLVHRDNDNSIIQEIQFTENPHRRKQSINEKDFTFLSNTSLLIEMTKNGSAAYIKTQLLTQQKKAILITSFPSSFSLLPMMGDICRVRYVYDNKIYDFESSVIRIALQPGPHLFLTYPQTLSFTAYRRYKRCKTSLSATLRNDSDGQLINGTVIDISSGGCRIAFPSDKISAIPEKLWLTIKDIVRDIGIIKKHETLNETNYLVGFEFAECHKSGSVSNRPSTNIASYLTFVGLTP